MAHFCVYSLFFVWFMGFWDAYLLEVGLATALHNIPRRWVWLPFGFRRGL